MEKQNNSKDRRDKWVGRNQQKILSVLSDGQFHKTEELAKRCGIGVKDTYMSIQALRHNKEHDIIHSRHYGYIMGNGNVPIMARVHYIRRAIGQAVCAERRMLIGESNLKGALQNGNHTRLELIAAKKIYRDMLKRRLALEMADIAPKMIAKGE